MAALIYPLRIECTVCGNGPYNCSCAHWFGTSLGESFLAAHETKSFLRTRPNIAADFPGVPSDSWEQYYSGFKNEAQLFAWFTVKELKLLQNNGFTLSQYATRNWHQGRSGKQILFSMISRKKRCTLK